MDFPRPSKSPSELIGGLKDRFGFGGNDRAYDDRYDEAPYDESLYAPEPMRGYDEYDPDTYGDPYDRLEYTTRGSGTRPMSARLVDSRDIRATTSAYGVSTVAVGADTGVEADADDAIDVHRAGLDVPSTSYTDFVSPYEGRTSGASRASSVPRSSSPGLDSLFEPSTGSSRFDAALDETASTASAAPASSAAATASSAADATLGLQGVRGISMVKPQVYDDVSTIARSVKAGDIVVLLLRNTDPSLSKRVLDFSFGVASALDARVECVAEKTFVVAQGAALTTQERARVQQSIM